MHYMLVRYSRRFIGSAAVNWMAAITFSVIGSAVFASNAVNTVDEVGTTSMGSHASIGKAGNEGTQVDTDATVVTQCSDSEWYGTPLIARYQVSNYSIAKRTMPTPGDSGVGTGRDAVNDEGLKTDLYRSKWIDSLLSDPSAESVANASTFVLWREGDYQRRVAHEHPKLAITEVWNKPSDRLLRRSRHFDAFNRAIEFEPFGIRQLPNPKDLTRTDTVVNRLTTKPERSVNSGVLPEVDIWMQKYHLASQLPQADAPAMHPDGYTELLKQGVAAGADPQLLAGLSSRKRCHELKVLHERQQRYISEIVWDESIRLPVYMQTVRDNSTPLDFSRSKSERASVGASSVISRWVLVSLESDEDKVGDRFAAWDSHDTTDFADIGDNESDPFLLKMINLGFISHGASGFYDASGNMISSGVGHFHPPARGAR